MAPYCADRRPPRAEARPHRQRIGAVDRLDKEAAVDFDVIVEISRGSHNKYEFHGRAGRIPVDRMLFAATRSPPADYGFIDYTWGRDGALVLAGDPAFSGCPIGSRAVGMFVRSDEKGPDEQLPCVPAHDPRCAAAQDIGGTAEFEQLKIIHVLGGCKDLETGTSVERSPWEGREQAYIETDACRARATGHPT
jgi:inorganic pyrophosphatase